MTQLGMFAAATSQPEPGSVFVFGSDDSDEIVVDSFAGGGGASEGIRRALGYSPHIAINHHAPAIALHSVNHPDSEHYPLSVWRVDPVKVCRGRRVGLAWFSPDCKDFSKAKSSKPISRKIRGLAWTAVRWASKVAPRIIVLENVEEFQGWGPLYPANHPNPKLRDRRIPEKKGKTFRAFVRKLERVGYVVEWRLLRGCDYGAPTSRRRLFLIARRDAEAIVWPKATHGPGRTHPHRVAAECIDWSIPCHSIFLTADEARTLWKEHRIKVNRPLVDNTMRRIGRGVWRFVINNPRPFIVAYHSPKTAGEDRNREVSEPLPTLDTSNRFALVTPFIAGVGGRQGQSPERSLERPYQTITTKNDSAIVAPFLAPVTHPGDQRVHSLEEPMRTVTGANRGEEALIAPVLIPRYGEWPNHPARGSTLDQPMPTVVPTQNGAQLCATFLAKHFGDAGQRPGSSMDEPVDTVTARDHNAVVAAGLLHFKSDAPSDVSAPMPTQTTKDCFGLVASSLVKFKGTAKDGQSLDEPLHTVQSGGNHYAEVRAFLTAFYGNEKHGQGLLDPMRTVTSNDRFGVVTVAGADYVIRDIGMRVLVPRELARAQGFHDSYILEIEYDGKPLSKEEQTSMIGNSVNPDLACALVMANYRPRTASRGRVA